ncbi:hypothetical protein IQ37_05155 [Chryseobacterium piperi]|uniref:Lipoprotein n=1 Tax=Chryseobacterium piperi TaxID=558152 RepID=A0A086BKZ1_9FLAO|nr:copper resistance protein NlpE [Chryseobacterium piperi]ASW74445.1 copper resistance protein NlpE [Chryseobacterium piperi]KFF29605.1 hypothetical protein IQ37_05155 [Chryseobacterium piperi]
MKNNFFLTGSLLAILLTSCSPKEKTQEISSNSNVDSAAIHTSADSASIANAIDTHNSQNSLDWDGTYDAVVPCADCPGIKTSLTLNQDKTFSITEEYIDRKSKNEDKGTFEWDATGSIITLKGKTANYKYKVGENMLIQLDLDGKEIDGPNKDLYVFKKK